MANIPNEQTITASEAARRIGVEVYTLRRWCDWHAAHLSPGAKPGESQARRLTQRDIEVLRSVKALRDQGLQTEAINQQLAQLTFAVVETSFTDAPPLAQETHSTALAQKVGIDSQAALQAITGRLDAIERTQKDRFTWFMFGFLASAAIFGLMLLLAVLYGR